MVEGNTQHRYKDALAVLEQASPGTKDQMYFGFLKKAASRFEADTRSGDLAACSRCGAATVSRGEGETLCSFCRTKDLAEHNRDRNETRARRANGRARA